MLVLASGTAIAQIISVASTPAITRLYTPTDIGLFAIFTAFVTFWGSGVTLRYEQALLIAPNDAATHAIVRLALICAVTISLAALPVFFVLRTHRVLGFGLLPPWALFLCIPVLLAQGAFNVYRFWGLRAQAVKRLASATVASSLATTVVKLIAGLPGLGLPGLLTASVAGPCASTVRLIGVTTSHFAASRPSRLALSDLRDAARRYIKFPMLDASSTWINQLSLSLPIPMVAALHGAQASGWFGLAWAITMLPNRQVGSAVGDAYQMELARAVGNGDTIRARKLLNKTMKKLALFGLLPLIAFASLSPLLAPLILGAPWTPVGYTITLITPWIYASLVFSPLGQTFSVLNAQEYRFAYDLIAIALLGIAFLFSNVQHYSYLHTVAAIAIARLLSYVVCWACIVRAMNHYSIALVK